MKKAMAAMTLAALAGAAFGQAMSLYSPVRSIRDQAISLRPWGSGTIGETDELAFEGTYSIRVSTRNYFQGGTMAMEKPVELAGAFGDKNNLLRFTVRVADVNLTLGGGGAGGGNAPRGAGAGGGASTGGGLAGGEEGRQGGAGGAASPPTSTLPPEATQLKNLRFIFSTSDGKKSEIYVPINTSRLGDRNWITVAVPLQAITGFEKTNKSVSGIGISGDAISTFYIGDIRVVNDSTPINGEMSPNQDRNLALGDEVEFRGRGFGGSSVLRYSWDFDESDGIQTDAEGAVIKRRFRRPGTFTVTLTITDVYGLKAPYTTKVKVKVNP